MSNQVNNQENAAVTSSDTAQEEIERTQWQTLAGLADREDFETFLYQEYPREAAVLQRSGMERRTFLKLMGASLALFGASGCMAKPPNEPIIPYVEVPEEIVPGRPLFFASTATLSGFATGVLIETHEGRPTRIEGNPAHPASLGGSDVFLQASILELYNPDRSINVRTERGVQSWDGFVAALNEQMSAQQGNGGAGLRILTETVTSPTLAGQLAALAETYPNAKWVQYEPANRDALVEGSIMAFGQIVNTVYDLEAADLIVSLDADFLGSAFPGHLRYARQFGAKRKVQGEGAEAQMNRLYAVEATPTITGGMADHRLALRASQVADFARALASAVGVGLGVTMGSTPWDQAWFDTLVADLEAHRGASVIMAGPEQPPVVHALAHAMNTVLGNVQQTLTYTEPVEANPVVQMEELAALVDEMNSGAVDALIILGGNPAYTAPADLAFGDALGQVPFKAHLSFYYDETSGLCDWHIPASHYIEMWSDARAFDGTASLVQPPIGPLYEATRSDHEMLALMLQDERSAYEIVRAQWQSTMGEGDFEILWRRALHDGVVADSAAPAVETTLRADFLSREQQSSASTSDLELTFRPDSTIWDGRYSGNSWLQELPKPLSKLTWDNAAMVSPATAARLGINSEDLVDLQYAGRTVRAPVWILAGHPNDAITVALGYGRTAGPEVGIDAGFNANAVRTSDSPWMGDGVTVVTTGATYTLAATQDPNLNEGEHPPVQTGTLAGYQADPHFLHAAKSGSGLIAGWDYEGTSWGMTIDLSACIGCNACVIACQSENNIPSVGKDQIKVGRDMSWLRIDRYYEGDLDDPKVYFQPVPCMHCEKAPCELVCPVTATVHSDEGLNQMVYNRCIGTRYCANNCPYTVRRFNFKNYVDDAPILLELRNPDVSIRPKGVMEKCTYCVQRISAANIASKKENRPIWDGEVVTACASACPTQAITFGDINDPESRVVQEKTKPLNYSLLAELNTEPRTTYLARLTNPNEALDGSESEG